jgi:serine/threonine protein kinase/energy-coupling factor transporter ATP-binding protein EcfA2
MTMALSRPTGCAQELSVYEVGDTITLAEVAEETIHCDVVSLLGKGAAASVFKIMTSGKLCALKVFKAGCSFLDLSTEASLLLMTNHPKSHPNVLQADFVWYEEHTNEMFFLMVLIDGGDLQTWMDDERLYAGTEDEQQQRLVAIAHQLACAIRHLHQQGIVHQDIKPDNVFMTADGKPVLGDLGVASKGDLDSAGMIEATLRGATPVYASPHVRDAFFRVKALPVQGRRAFLAENKITHLDDIWAMAATIVDTFADCGWRRGRSVAEVLGSRNSLASMAKLLRVPLPSCMLDVLSACLGFSPAAGALNIDSPVELLSTMFACPPVLTQDGLNGKRCASIYNNLAIALSNSGHHHNALALLEQAVAAGGDDARSHNNLGVVKHAQGEVDSAMCCFDRALVIEPDHSIATYNAGIKERGEGTEARFDRSGAAGAVEDNSGQVELVDAFSFDPEQQVDVYKKGTWECVDATSSEQPLLRLNYRPLRCTWYAVDAQRLFVLHRGEWCIGTVSESCRSEFDREIQKAKSAQSKLKTIERKDGGDFGATCKLDAQAKKKAQEHRDEEQHHRKNAQLLVSRHTVAIETQGSCGAETVALQLDETNHAPALFIDRHTMERAVKSYKITLVDKHASIIDIFSGRQLSTRTQTVALQYHEAEWTAQVLSRNDDVDSLGYQGAQREARADKSEPSVEQTRLDATGILARMCNEGSGSGSSEHIGPQNIQGTGTRGSNKDSELVLILGPAASGKTTLLKTLIMAVVHQYTYLVPVLIPVIEVVPVLSRCDVETSVSVVKAFLQHRYPQHAHMLLQLMLMHRVIFLIDGIDESGSSRDAVETFVKVELVERGHRTIITSRHSGFSNDAFKQCQLVELLPLSVEQQSQMVRTRVLDGEQAEQLVKELRSGTFKDISSNPLMLTMMISIYLNNNCKLISNRSELYEKALRTIVSRTDKFRTGVGATEQDDLFAQLQKLASGSHERDGERRIFTMAEATKWVGSGSWKAIHAAIREGRLPIIVSMGPNTEDEEEYRFSHMSYQEYLTGREYYQELTAAQFSTAALAKLFGSQPLHTFTDVKQHLVLELLAGILSPEQRTMCLAVMCGGRVEVRACEPSRKCMTSTCKVAGCPETHCNTDGYCHNHRDAAASALETATMHGGDALAFGMELGKAGMEALAPYLQQNTHLQTLLLSGAKLGQDGMVVLTQALLTNTTITALDLSNNDLGAAGANAVAELLARCVR